MKILSFELVILMGCLFTNQPVCANEKTYAERLGWPTGAKVVIFHVDDVAMSHESNIGAIKALENGVATSWSLMMPCGWVPEIKAYLKKNPQVDVGVHLTLTSEWDNYRWFPVAGAKAVPGLVDADGYLWDTVKQVQASATPDEVETEIRAQIDKALAMGITPTHIDSHMGTVLRPEYIERYIKVGIEKNIPVMMFGGHLQHVGYEAKGHEILLRQLSEKLWQAGLPVLDDLVTEPAKSKDYSEKKEQLKKLLKEMKPGVTQIIVHCSDAGEHFTNISGSGTARLAEMKLMMDEDIREYIKTQGIILTTWRELKQRRDKIGF
ncbi:MAG TPA: polysaccharide deacetylase family protein [Sedimentisphaerales bacterium]|nr:polysaccharide deacetylase family protein [Sedimentisphaerales bacterium]